MVYLGFALATIARFESEEGARPRRRPGRRRGLHSDAHRRRRRRQFRGAIVVAARRAERDGSRASAASYFTLAALTILISWILIHVMFALHYAHEFYGGEDVGRGGGLKFPGDPRPDYWDFVYFSFVIGMTFQVSDVQVTGKHLRRLVVAHGVVAFFFSVAILALAVNIGSQMI